MFKDSVVGWSTDELKYRQCGWSLCSKRRGKPAREGSGDLCMVEPLKQVLAGLETWESLKISKQRKKIIRFYLENIPLQCREQSIVRVKTEGHLGGYYGVWVKDDSVEMVRSRDLRTI